MGIDYFSLMIIDSCNITTFYSTCPALEYNLIINNLWQFDGIFEIKNHTDGAFLFWDELYPEDLKTTLISEKEKKFGFNFGFYIMKKFNNAFIIYSFATKSQFDKALYRNSKDTLSKIGDCFFNELKSIHSQYVAREKEGLRLVVDNKKKIFSKKEVEC